MILSTNQAIAEKLREIADLLESQEADGFRIKAYRLAAKSILSLGTPVEDIVKQKELPGLIELPGIGKGIGSAILEMLATGRWAQLERLRGTLEPEKLFQTIPGVGPELARRIHDELHADTLAEVELAAHDGRLAEISGIGERRAAAIRAILGERLGRRRIRAKSDGHWPPVSMLLDVDREYRERAVRGELPTIAPQRFNPSGERWLPVLHTARGEWQFTGLFSNTQKAHELGKTHDWVVIFFHQAAEPEAQCAVVTEMHGALAGRRVVRGREGDCAAYYAATETG